MSGGGERPAADGGIHPVQSKREFFDAVASDWEGREFSSEERIKVERLRERLGNLRGRVVFEPGCGTGRLTRLLAGWVGENGRVLAVDNSAQMVEAARRTAAGPAVEIHCARAEEISVAPGTLDLALLFCVFPHFDDKAAALRRFAPMLKREGRLVIAHLEGSEQLNTFHEGAGEPVRKDRIPASTVLIEMLQASGLRLRTFIDAPEEFYLEAVPAGLEPPFPDPERARG